MDKISELNQRISDLNVAVEYKKKQVIECQEQLSLARISGPKDDGKIGKLTGQIDSLKKEIGESLPAEIDKTKEAIGLAKKEAQATLMKRVERATRLPEMRKKGRGLLVALREAERINDDLKKMHIACEEISKKEGVSLDLKGTHEGFGRSIKALADVSEGILEGKKRDLFYWPVNFEL